MQLVKPLENLIRQLSRLPGIGPKTAQRLAYRILDMPAEEVRALAAALTDVKENLVECPVCHNITDRETIPCAICRNPARNDQQLCVVEQVRDILVMEKSGRFQGRYHVLKGVISPMEGTGPEDLTIGELKKRVEAGEFREIIIATNPSVEGEATAMYLSRLLKRPELTVTRLAHGLPIGGELEYADELTLSYAFEGRKEI